MSWVNDLDALAAAGVLEYDAPADIMGTKPRYFGNPQLDAISGTLPPIKQQPQKDEFQKDSTIHHNPSWKKWLFGGIAAVAVFLGVKNIKSLKSVIKNINFSNIKKLPQKAWNGIKTGFNKIKSLFHKTPKP